MSPYAVFEEAARGKLPPQDGRVEVCGAGAGKAAGAVVAFPAHFYVVAPVEPGWVHGMLPAGDFTAPLGARFLTALADRLGAGIGSVDASRDRPPGQSQLRLPGRIRPDPAGGSS